MQLQYQSISTKLMHNQTYYKVVDQNKNQGMWWDAPERALIQG
jgi:hypothetical protein